MWLFLMRSRDETTHPLSFLFLVIGQCFRSALRPWVGLVLLAIIPATLSAAYPLGEIIVTGTLSERLGTAGSASRIDGDALAEIRHTHIHEALSRVPGTWVNRGSGQEHLTAIRSAVFTGPGACGEVLYLEDGLPIRPAGFCNINNLFEVNGEQAVAIEVWRGPSSAVLGGNALHGAINVLTASPEGTRLSIESGAYGYTQARAVAGGHINEHYVGLSAHGSQTDGYRAATGYDQQKFSLVHAIQLGTWQVRNTFNATNLNQNTGGYVLGFKAYKDRELRRTNANPGAYRDAWSWRAASHWQREQTRISVYLRRSHMEFLQHFLPGQPTETNEQTSGGALVRKKFEADTWAGQFGAHLEAMQGSLLEFQEQPTTGSAFLMATRPAGRHYDYDVDSIMAAGFYDLSKPLSEGLHLVHSLRLEHLRYEYDNRHLTGNSRDDGSVCGFGGCLYTRPASRDDRFTEVAGRLGLEREFGVHHSGYLVLSTGFRPPQATELYRLQQGQTVADLDSERLLSAEIGFRSTTWSLSAFSEWTRDFIFRDASGFNVSDGKTRSRGLEFSGDWHLGDHALNLAVSYAVHKYDFTREAGRGEVIEKGNMMDSAPRWLTHARWRYQPAERWYSEFELSQVGEHYINAANTAKYEGHVVLNWRSGYRLTEHIDLFARVINLLDERYADRADHAFGAYRYFPAMPLQAYIGVNVAL